MVFGVEDPQRSKGKGIERVFGIEENPDLFDEIGRAVKKISPPIGSLWQPELIPVKSQNKNIALLAVPKVGDGLRSIEGHVYIRQERGNKRLSPQEIVHFDYIKGFERADKELVIASLTARSGMR